MCLENYASFHRFLIPDFRSRKELFPGAGSTILELPMNFNEFSKIRRDDHRGFFQIPPVPGPDVRNTESLYSVNAFISRTFKQSPSEGT